MNSEQTLYNNYETLKKSFPNNGKYILCNQDKKPLSYETLQVSSAFDPKNWLTLDKAIFFAEAYQVKVGFVLTKEDRYFCVDIDGCLDADGQWTTLAQDILGRFPGCYIEISQSGRGLHVIGLGDTKIASRHRKKKAANGLELYTENRFISLTGKHASGNSLCEASTALNQLIEEHFQKSTEFDNTSDARWTTESHRIGADLTALMKLLKLPRTSI